MRHIILLVCSLLLTIFLSYISDFIGSEQRILVNYLSTEKVKDYYRNLRTTDPNAADELDEYLKNNTRSQYTVADIVGNTRSLTVDGVKALRKKGIILYYMPEIGDDLMGYAQTNLVRFILFFFISLPITYTIDFVRRVRPCLFHIPVGKLRHEVAITLREIVGKNDPLGARLCSPNQSLLDNTVIGNIRAFDNGTSSVGLVLVRSDCELVTYAAIAKEFDRGAKKSIMSTNVSVPSQLFSSVSRIPVIDHIKEVNNRIRSWSKIKVQRIQVHRNDSEKKAFEAELGNSSLQSTTDYMTHFKVKNINYSQVTLGQDKPWEEYLGDYIVYDNKLVLKYDEDTRQLVLMIGNEIIKQHFRIFR